MNNLQWKSLSDLKDILKSLKLYKDLSEKLWNRWRNIFKSISNNTPIYKIEYFESSSRQDALEEWLIAYKKIFGDTPKAEEINLVARKSLEWWIRIYKWDNLVDLSFKKASETLK
jgi:hypothetical protein